MDNDINEESPLPQDDDMDFMADYDFEVTPSSPHKSQNNAHGSLSHQSANTLPRRELPSLDHLHSDFDNEYDDELNQMEAEFALHHHQHTANESLDDLFSPQIENNVVWEFQSSTGAFVSQNDISGQPEDDSVIISEKQILTTDQIQFQEKAEYPDDYLFDISVDSILKKRGPEIRRALDIVPMLGTIKFSEELIQKLTENQVLHLMQLNQVLLEIRHQEFLAERDERLLISRKIEEYIQKKSGPSAVSKSPRTTRRQNEELFEQVDMNRDGFISSSEFKEGMRKMGTILTDEHVKHIIDGADLNDDQKIDIHEFHGLMEMLDADEDEDGPQDTSQLQKEREKGLITQLKKMETSNSELAKERIRLQAQMKRLERELTDARGQIALLTDKYSPLEERVVSTNREIQRLEAENAQIKVENKKLDAICTAQEKDLNSSKKSHNEALASLEQNVKQFSAMSQGIPPQAPHPHDSERVVQLQTELNEHKTKLSKLEQNLENSAKDLEEHRAKCESLQEDKTKADMRSQTWQQQLEDMNLQLAQLNAKLSAQSTHHATQEEMYRNAIQSLEENVAHLHQQLEFAVQCAPSLTFDIDPLFAPMDLITPSRVESVQTARLQNHLKETEEQMESFQYEAHVLQKERDMLSTKNQHQSQAMRHYKNLVATLEDKIAECEAERDLASTKLRDLLQMLRAKEESLERLELVIPAYEQKVSNLLKDVARLKRQTEKTIKSNNHVFREHVAQSEENAELQKLLTPHDIVDCKLSSSKIIINSSRKRQRSRPSSAMSSIPNDRTTTLRSSQRDSIIIRSAFMKNSLRPRLSLPKKDDIRQRIWIIPYCNVHSIAYTLLVKKKDERWSCFEGLPSKKQLSVDSLYTIAEQISSQTLGLLSNPNKITEKGVEDSITALYRGFKQRSQRKGGKAEGVMQLQVPSNSKKNIDLCMLAEIPYIPVNVFQAHLTGAANVILTSEAAQIIQKAGNLEYAWVKISLLSDVVQRTGCTLQGEEFHPNQNSVEWREGEILNPFFARVLVHAGNGMRDLFKPAPVSRSPKSEGNLATGANGGSATPHRTRQNVWQEHKHVSAPSLNRPGSSGRNGAHL
uniref:EF-hand domain-containing protein n=1 Tax=Percolomonas cosmopolitus TaxID=63605 RepID=A0A7S1KNZ1_9EUKA|mmetsp:Transcript_2724/g.10459  ORF Transcript_2724/g.10459 Transcript_2724/m.10459 type:complete len:1093 (+) Transcript_2724:383-3661(+)|eukprot:CAMPEP_0117442930 /NCGR_PEP_ID=MMETSP0759-20121206/4417_1 /TAXON_ID=63605 /ORGANISM="Percolomonas cosmopolitus, Strain WS" /LENGTH=1092 /DNA_ID=CAMNT_0005234857 /DNA_START=357 /DNA_END=3635 /DNA_ORIENTATION=+